MLDKINEVVKYRFGLGNGSPIGVEDQFSGDRTEEDETDNEE
jgi:hypothetical protein